MTLSTVVKNAKLTFTRLLPSSSDRTTKASGIPAKTGI
jgi:hypothetical protein